MPYDTQWDTSHHNMDMLVQGLKALYDQQQRKSRSERDAGLADDHEEADSLLLFYVRSTTVSELFNSIDKWYE